MIIKNKDALTKSKLRADALEICEAGLSAINTHDVLKKGLRFENNSICINDKICLLDKINRIVVVGVGKNSTEALKTFEEILGTRLHAGFAFDTKELKDCILQNTKCYIGTHPNPSEKNVEATKRLVETLTNLKEDDLVIFVISGGGSTLLCMPEENSLCTEEANILKELFKTGATIQEINTVRKHLSLARGGFLAKYAYPAQVLSLIFSDVPGNNIEFIASGPTVKDTTTIFDAKAILEKYDILKKCGMSSCGLIETPKEDRYFEKVTNILLVSNDLALKAMAEKSKELGFEPVIQTNELSGEARSVGLEIAHKINSAMPSTAHLYGGETTVTIKGNGQGGRNQELVLATVSEIRDEVLILSINSDGRDNTDHAGALCDIITQEETKKIGLNIGEFLNQNNSYEFFVKTGDYLDTGNLNSNVSDLIIALKK